MNRKYITVFVLGFLAMIGWNVFLVQRDDAMYKAYYRQQAIENLKHSPSNQIRQCIIMISKRIRELIMNAEREKVAREFWEEIEREAAKLQVTVDYYLAEFY